VNSAKIEERTSEETGSLYYIKIIGMANWNLILQRVGVYLSYS
jgi:hypothetical protein